MITERERKLLIEAYIIGMQHGAMNIANDIVIRDIRHEAARWVDEPIADNGANVGQYIGWELLNEANQRIKE